MSTEVIGYLAMPQRTTEKPTERLTEQRKIKAIQIPDAIIQKLTGVIMMELGALTIPMCDGDGTAFIMLMLFGIGMLIGSGKE